VASTERIAQVGDRRWLDLLDAHDTMVGRQIDRFRGRQVTATGDGVLAMFDGPTRAVECACAIRDAGARLGIAIRAGLHTGEVETRRAIVGGIAVHIVARVAALTQSAEVLVSRVVTDLVAGSGLRFVERGTHGLKGIAGEWRIYAVS